MIWKKGKYLKTSTMVTVIFMQSVMEIAPPVKKLSFKNWSNLSGVWHFSVTNFKLPDDKKNKEYIKERWYSIISYHFTSNI